MKKAILALVAILATALAALGAAFVGSGPSAGTASSPGCGSLSRS